MGQYINKPQPQSQIQLYNVINDPKDLRIVSVTTPTNPNNILKYNGGDKLYYLDKISFLNGTNEVIATIRKTNDGKEYNHKIIDNFTNIFTFISYDHISLFEKNHIKANTGQDFSINAYKNHNISKQNSDLNNLINDTRKYSNNLDGVKGLNGLTTGAIQYDSGAGYDTISLGSSVGTCGYNGNTVTIRNGGFDGSTLYNSGLEWTQKIIPHNGIKYNDKIRLNEEKLLILKNKNNN